MMNSKHALLPEDVIASLMELISEERMASQIDEPIEIAAQTFQLKVKVPLSHSSFNHVISRFVSHLYLKGLRLSRLLSEKEALAEAISLLEKSYYGIYSKGYDGALLDATGSKLEGLDLVLSRLLESIKEIERRKYVEWVFCDNVDQLDWDARYQLVKTYLTRYKNLLSPQLRDMNPAQLTENFQDLILTHLSTDSHIKQVFGTDMGRIKSLLSSTSRSFLPFHS